MKPAHEYKEKELYENLEPYIGAWFGERYHHFTPPQKYAIVEIINKKNIVICAPTGSGKTFACFLGILNYLCKLNRTNKLEDRTFQAKIQTLCSSRSDGTEAV
ncbi:MAG: DEAD/DEAH box helicase [archaeon]|nr:DEAD/DEAH box helicase [archaeon]MDI6885112.1 DEAD/DEAH box helicase [archaeon]